MLRLLRVAVILSAMVAGCARSPEGVVVTTPRLVTFRIELGAPVIDSPEYHYYIAIDATPSGTGPTPVFPTPGVTPENEWLTGSATHFIEYTQHAYTVYKIKNVQPFEIEQNLGAPYNATLPEPGGKTLLCTVDLNELGITSNFVDINFICIYQPAPDVRMIDGLGPGAIDYLSEVNVGTDQTIRNANSLDPTDRLERELDVLDEDRMFVPGQPTAITGPLDIVDWTITVDA